MIESSAKWAGFNSEEAKRSVGLLKALVGDTVIGNGRVSVEYGPSKNALTPRTRLYEIVKDTYEKLCKGLLKKIDNNGNRLSIDRLIKNDELKEIGGNKQETYVDKQTLRKINRILKRLYKLDLDEVFPNLGIELERSSEFTLPTSALPNMPMPNVNIVNTTQNVDPRTNLTRTETALLSPEEQVIASRT